MVDAYALTLAALVLTAGSLADRLGRRRLFAAGLGIFSVASLLCGLAPDATFLNLARALQGVGGAVMFAVALALIAQEFPAGRQRGTAMGLYGATIGEAASSGSLHHALAAVPPQFHHQVFNAAHEGFLAGFNDVLMLGGLVSFAGAVLALWLVREREIEREPIEPAGEPETVPQRAVA